MKKPLSEGLITFAVFLSAWLMLSRVNWVEILRVEKVTSKTEEKLGDLFWESFKESEEEVTDRYVLDAVDSILTQICEANSIRRSSIKLHILDTEDINAFALPDGHLVVYSGLILNTDKPEELAGVMSHELAHIELQHVMKKLVKEIGLSVLISMTGGSSGAEVIGEAGRLLSSSAFDRRLERDADIQGVDYLMNAGIDPEPFADFLYKLATETSDDNSLLNWISTHPESKERAEYIIDYTQDDENSYKNVLTSEAWDRLKERLEE